MDALVGPIRSKLLEYGTIETMLTYQTDRSQMWDACVVHGPTFRPRSLWIKQILPWKNGFECIVCSGNWVKGKKLCLQRSNGV